jgi:superoxide reductase
MNDLSNRDRHGKGDAGNEPAGRVDLRPGLSQPVVTFHLALDKPVTLVAREYCNLHGLWESRREVALG